MNTRLLTILLSCFPFVCDTGADITANDGIYSRFFTNINGTGFYGIRTTYENDGSAIILTRARTGISRVQAAIRVTDDGMIISPGNIGRKIYNKLRERKQFLKCKIYTENVYTFVFLLSIQFIYKSIYIYLYNLVRHGPVAVKWCSCKEAYFKPLVRLLILCSIIRDILNRGKCIL